MALRKYIPRSVKLIIKKIYLRYSVIGPFAPAQISIELTNVCNSKCTMCPRPGMVANKEMEVGHIDFELFKKIVREIPKNKKTIITLVGMGDPLLYPKLEAAIKYVRKTVPLSQINISSNGIALNKRNAELLIRSLKEKDFFTVSLNASDQKAYKWLMGVDQYENVVNNIKNFLTLREKMNGSTKPRLVIQMLETKRSEGVRFRQYWQPLVSKRDFISIKALLNWGGVINTKKMGTLSKGTRYPCVALWIIMSIDKDGNIFPCCNALSTREKSAIKLGNIADKSLTEIYNQNVEKIRELHLTQKWNEIPDCAKCDFWSDTRNIWFKFNKRWY